MHAQKAGAPLRSRNERPKTERQTSAQKLDAFLAAVARGEHRKNGATGDNGKHELKWRKLKDKDVAFDGPVMVSVDQDGEISFERRPRLHVVGAAFDVAELLPGEPWYANKRRLLQAAEKLALPRREEAKARNMKRSIQYLKMRLGRVRDSDKSPGQKRRAFNEIEREFAPGEESREAREALNEYREQSGL